MRSVVWIALFLLGVTGVVVPSVYLHTASQLPRLESEYDLELLLRFSIEGERLTVRRGRYEHEERSRAFVKPEFSRLPKDLIALYISQLGCPGYFRSPREQGPRWAWRLMASTGDVGIEGDGRCEQYFASRIAQAAGVQGELETTVAANKLHAFLSKGELVAWDFASMKFERGVIGVEDAAWELYRKPLEKMSLSELAEFTLAMPVHGYYPQLKECKNASLIKQNRDFILGRLEEQGLASAAKVKDALAAPVACLAN